MVCLPGDCLWERIMKKSLLHRLKLYQYMGLKQKCSDTQLRPCLAKPVVTADTEQGTLSRLRNRGLWKTRVGVLPCDSVCVSCRGQQRASKCQVGEESWGGKASVPCCLLGTELCLRGHWVCKERQSHPRGFESGGRKMTTVYLYVWKCVRHELEDTSLGLI